MAFNLLECPLWGTWLNSPLYGFEGLFADLSEHLGLPLISKVCSSSNVLKDNVPVAEIRDLPLYRVGGRAKGIQMRRFGIKSLFTFDSLISVAGPTRIAILEGGGLATVTVPAG